MQRKAFFFLEDWLDAFGAAAATLGMANASYKASIADKRLELVNQSSQYFTH